jgi:hypothetical protein
MAGYQNDITFCETTSSPTVAGGQLGRWTGLPTVLRQRATRKYPNEEHWSSGSEACRAPTGPR